MPVPEVLRNGDHAKIRKYREEHSRQRSAERRPELLAELAERKGRS
jgi:tRNA (guanine37-N1)-methyltransferase